MTDTATAQLLQQAPANLNAPVTEYVFPAYWGGAVRSPNPPLIHDKLRELRLAVGGVAAKKQQGGPMFPVRSAKDLVTKLAQALCDLDLVAPVVAQEVNFIDTDKIPGNTTASGKPVFRTLVHVRSTVRIGASDGSYVELVGSGHGGDVDDKAGGKASTYAWKDAILKGLTTPEQDMVDTDDDQPSADEDKAADRPARGRGTRGASKAAGTAPATGAGEGDGGASGSAPTGDGGGAPVSRSLAYVKQKIDEATSQAELEAVGAAIKSGTLDLDKGDRLAASVAYVAKMNAIKGATKS